MGNETVVLQLARTVSAIARIRLMTATCIVEQVAHEAGLDLADATHWNEIIDLSTKIMVIHPDRLRPR